jgi:flavin reductase (DIM6/NTAB) family NADH-FMN oxidoreductase RutF
MIATYGENDVVNVMNMAYGGVIWEDLVELNIMATHKTAKNIEARKAFTISVANVPHIKEADFLGTASGNDMPDKFERTGLHAVKSSNVDAPVVEEFPVTLECKVLEIQNDERRFRVVGEIINALADESVLDESGEIDASKVNALVFDQFQNSYFSIGEKVGKAWESGAELMK